MNIENNTFSFSADTLDELLNQQAENFSEHVFIIFDKEKFSYKFINELVTRAANELKAAADVRGKFVALICGNTPEFVVAYFAILRAGGKVVPINPRLGTEEIKYILSETRAEIILHPKNINLEKFGAQNSLLNEKALNIQTTKINDFSAKPLFENIDDIASCIFTSGTTGNPKGALLSHKAIMHNARMCAHGLKSREKAECFVGVLPLFHAFSASACLMQTVLTGGKLLLVEQFKPAEILKQMAEHRATVFLGVPAMYAVMANVENPPELPDLRLCVSGGAPLPETVFNAFFQKFKIKICEGDGPTECGPATSINPVDGKIKVGTIGLPLCDVKMKIVDDDGQELPRGERGEIIVKSPSNFSGYLNRYEDTAATLKNGWVFTGDIGFEDEDGYFTIVDRKKDMLLVGGLNVYPREIEEYLRRHPDVADVAVVGKDCGLRGEIPVAFIVTKSGEKLSLANVKSFLKDKIANYKIPREIKIIDELPRNATGKILKKELRK